MDRSKKEEQLVELLRDCTPGNLSEPVFEAIARVAVYPAVEVIPYRRKGREIEVGLLKRPQDDRHWPGMWHLPGTVLRPTDASLHDAFERLYADEFEPPNESQPEFMGVGMVAYRRGTGLTIEHALRFDMKTQDTKLSFFNINDLPVNFIVEQQAILDRFRVYIGRSSALINTKISR